MATVCTPEEIAEKRRIAVEKLAKRNVGNKHIKAYSKVAVEKYSNNVASTDSNILSVRTSVAFYNKQSSVSSSDLNSNNVENRGNSYEKFALALQKNSNRHDIKSPIRSAIPIFGSKIVCEVAMISDNRFFVKPMKYHEQLINILKTIPSKQYDANTRLWTFNICDYEILQEKVMALRPEIELEQIPKKILYILRESKEEIDFSFLPTIEPKLVSCLMEFQKEGVCFGIAKQGRILIADEMGLGKTLQALAIADYFKEDWPILITTTASTRNSWFNHIKNYMSSVRCHDVVNLNSSDFYIYDAKIVITSYSLMEKHVEKLIERKFGILIFDESHSLKSFDAKRTKNAEKLAKLAQRIILLSGTPALSKPVELYCQLKMLDKNFLPFKLFSQRYCNGKQTNFGWDSSGQSNLEELNIVLKKKFMIRRLKSDVLSQLAEKNRETVMLNPELIRWNDEIKKKFNDYEYKLKRNGSGDKEILLTYYAKTAEIKARAVCDYLKNLIKEQKKFIVFAHHKIMMNSISDFLLSKKVNFIRIDGTTKPEVRDENVRKFQTNNLCRVALLSLHACNAGITLTAADLVIFAELDWNPSTLAQAESRAHRIGQKNTVTCRYLLAENTADTTIWKMLKEKQNVLRHAGLFSENLQNAEHSLAPSSSPKIDRYLTPTKRKLEDFNEPLSLTSVAKNYEAQKKPKTFSNLESAKVLNKTIGSGCNENCTIDDRENKSKTSTETGGASDYEYLFNELDDADIPRTPISTKDLKNEKEYDSYFNELEDDDFANLIF
ncbi:SWI/SNF-related matrix-associated actin-dependent regulator of chromatin subfamily A-like protein 1 [Condylostylus longicornis]|uniref:SWI/SNF-related matrix-associated actin-dependent regulator of chromatin subfamily A-like protein 1 n=1 Tax=Condylostylus longicornis TaxID=2530218 RepID=UPI00244E0704|nr:SWI/SNF-related matrix-associated actin-dependent regulator of chromatin subfamily A-like protein 1 [Condylostylus longicornis]